MPASPWGQKLTEQDYRALAVAFGFNNWQDFRDFAEEEQKRSDRKQIAEFNGYADAVR